MVGKEIESQTNILYVPVKRKQSFGRKEKNQEGRARKRESDHFAVEIC